MIFHGRGDSGDREPEREVTYWESMADVLSGVLLIFILIVFLSAFYSWRNPSSGDRDPSDTTETEEGSYDGNTDLAHRRTDAHSGAGETYPQSESRDADSAGGGDTDGGGGGRETEPVTEKTEDALAAVRLILIDGRTGKVIPQGGVQFELLSADGAEMTLYDYYPKLQKYHLFETTEQGDFYLPERIPTGTYAFHLLSEVEGYDSDLVQSFTIGRAYSWTDPYEMKFVLTHGRVSVSLTLTDAESGEAVSGASFALIAQDGARRGERAATLTTDAGGSAQVLNIDSGVYLLSQESIPQGYASVTDTELDLSGLTGTQKIALTEEKTEVTVALTDALEGTALSGARFRVTDRPAAGAELETAASGAEEDMTEGEPAQTEQEAAGRAASDQAEDETSADGREISTDETGSFVLTDLGKSRTYTISQISVSGEGYRSIGAPVSFTVDSRGRIGGMSRTQIAMTNAVNRLRVRIFDRLTGKTAGNLTAQLISSDGEAVEVSSGQTVEGIEAGDYVLKASSGADFLPGAQKSVSVKDRTEVQEAAVRVFTVTDLMLVCGAALIVLILAAAGIRALRRRRKKRDGR